MLPSIANSHTKAGGGFRYLVLIFFVLVFGIGLTGVVYYDNVKKAIKKERHEDLSGIADLKAGEISRWRTERLGDGRLIMNNSLIIDEAALWFKDPARTDIEKQLGDFMTSLLQFYQDYSSVFILDAKGSLRLGVPGKRELDPGALGLASEALRKGDVVLSDLYRNSSGEIHITLHIPLIDRRGGKPQPLGVLMLCIDPRQFLYPLVESWPIPSKSAETVLVRREGSDVLFLNTLHYMEGAALTLRHPVGDENLVAAMAVRGVRGIVEGVDYRGKRVIADLRKVQGSLWFLITKMDEEEIYAPVRERWQYVVLFVGVLIAGAGGGVAFVLRHQRAEFYRRQYQSELERRGLFERYEYLAKYANDIILLFDGGGDIIEANERAIESFGYSREELLRLGVRDIQPVETDLARLSSVTSEDWQPQHGLLLETVYRRKDGSTFPAEVSSRLIEIEGERIVQSIIRDITERKGAERQREDHFARLSSLLSLSVEVLSANKMEGMLQSVVDAAREMTSAGFCVSGYGYSGGVFRVLATAVDKDSRHPFPVEMFDGEKTAIYLDLIEKETTIRLSEERLSKYLRWWGFLGATADIRELLGARLMGQDGEVRGLLMLSDKRDGSFTEEDEVTLKQLAALASLGLQRIEAHDELERRVQERTLELERTVEALQKEIRERESVEEKLRQAERLKVVGQIVSGVAHEVRNPLNAILSITEALYQDLRDDREHGPSLEHIRTQVERLSHLMRDLLELGKPTQHFCLRKESVETVCAAAVGLWEQTTVHRKHSVRIAAHPEAAGVEVFADSARLQQVFLNLLENAAQNSPEGSEIFIHILEPEGTTARIRIIDQGLGIDPEKMPRIFEPFFTTRRGGTGLGLSIVKHIVDSHGGDIIIVNNDPPPGCTVEVSLPVAREETS